MAAPPLAITARQAFFKRKEIFLATVCARFGSTDAAHAHGVREFAEDKALSHSIPQVKRAQKLAEQIKCLSLLSP